MLRLSSLSDRAAAILSILIAVSLLASIFVVAAYMRPGGDGIYQPGIRIGNIFSDVPGPFDSDQQMKKFSSQSELRAFLRDAQAYFTNLQNAQNYAVLESGREQSGPAFMPDMGLGGLFASNTQSETRFMTSSQLAEPLKSGNDYSGTNVQVAGVDEADFIKTDGKYAYIISGSKLTIVDAYPPEDAKIVSKSVLDVPGGQELQNMYLNGNRLVIFYQEYGEQTVIPDYGYVPTNVYTPSTHALVVDVSAREDPKIIENYEVGGEYSSSRMLGGKVFLLTQSGVDYGNPIVPSIRNSSTTISPDVYYFDNPEQSYVFNSVTAIDLESVGSAKDLLSKTFMIGSGTTVYVSESNIYIAYQQNLSYEYLQNSKDRFFTAIVPLLPADVQSQIKTIEENRSLDQSEKWDRVSALLQDTYENLSQNEQAQLFSKMQNRIAEYDSVIARDSQKTLVHKISISGDTVLEHVAMGEVPGRLLNQFSMDEHDGRFRITTTSEYSTPQRFVMHNNVYTLDGEMDIVGKLEGVARDESIYAARFMGDRLYLVTFRQVDPFFVIDLSGDEPKVLGELKLPGYSTYLHPYDRDHVIGIGKETNGGQILGLKMAMFDVSDVSDPQAIDTYMIGGPQTESEALNDHRAFLFDKEKNILSIPVFSPEQYYYPADPSGASAPRTWSGFYIFGIDDDKTFDLKGQIQHEENYYGSHGRSFYINNTLYTVTPALMKMSDLRDMDEINQLALDGTGQLVGYLE